MLYTVGEMARMLDVPASTLRYYDKEGLLPFVMRSSGGIRMFQEYKCWYYETAKAAGSIEAPKKMSLEEIPPRFHSVRQHLQDVPKQLPDEMPKAI